MTAKRGPEWVKEERKFGLNNKTLEEAARAILKAGEGLDDAKVTYRTGRGRGGNYYYRYPYLRVVGWRKKSADELAAEKKAEEEKARKKIEAAEQAKGRRAADAKAARERAKKRKKESEQQKALAAAREAKELTSSVKAMKTLLRELGYEVKKT